MKSVKRCTWAKNELAIQYHDEEWGVPIRDDQRLFEFLILEAQNAGERWIESPKSAVETCDGEQSDRQAEEVFEIGLCFLKRGDVVGGGENLPFFEVRASGPGEPPIRSALRSIPILE